MSANLSSCDTQTPALDSSDLGQSTSDGHVTVARRLRSFVNRLRLGLYHGFPEVKLRRLVGRQGASIATTTTVRERICLYDEAVACCELGRFLEIGSFLGATAVVLAEAIRRRGPKGVVGCVDTWCNDAMTMGRKDTWKSFCANTHRWNDQVRAIRGTSQSVQLPDADPYDLVFIDGDHSYEATLADAERFAPLVREGGRLLFHDHVFYHTTVAPVVGRMLGTGCWVVSAVAENIISLRRDTRRHVPTAPSPAADRQPEP